MKWAKSPHLQGGKMPAHGVGEKYDHGMDKKEVSLFVPRCVTMKPNQTFRRIAL